MAQLTEESLLEAIKKDDIKAFSALMEKAQCGTYRLGRFPVLSLAYLYNSRRIISAYEKKFIKIPAYEELREPAEVSKKFSGVAGKCLRLYLNEVVTPPEMLLILDKTRRLTLIYPLTKPSSAVKGRLKSIYGIKYYLNVNFVGDRIILDKKPLSLRAKKVIAVVSACSVFAVSVAVCVPITVNALKPPEGEVTNLSQIDFGSEKEYTVKKDLVLTQSVEEVNCKITGNGHKIILKEGASLGACNGKISDLVIETSGGAVFTILSEKATVENVTINAVADITATEGTALVAITNYGTIDGVTVNISGKINAPAPSADGTADYTFGGIVQTNAFKSQEVYGTVKNCKVNFSQFSLSGEPAADAAFGGVAGINNGYLQDCTVTGQINADTFDISGVCSVNNGVISGSLNEADIYQTSGDTGWNPIACGIALKNTGTVQSCENKGSISAISTCGKPEGENPAPTVSAAGIVYINSNTVALCKNYGSVKAEGAGAAYAGGIAALSAGGVYSFLSNGLLSSGGIYTCLSSGDITVTAVNPYVGGILGCSEVDGENTIYGLLVYFGIIDHCVSEGKIEVIATGDAPACVGGIAGFVREAEIKNGEEATYLGGCVTNCYFTGKRATDGNYFGNIVGVCAPNIYESNSYTSGNIAYHNFGGNYYSDNSSTAFGATVQKDGSFVPVEDKGAAVKTKEDILKDEEYIAISEALGK